MRRIIFAFNLLLAVTAAPAQTAVPAWVQRYHGPDNGNAYATAIVLDSGTNVIVTGSSMGSGSGYDFATIKYSAAGVPLWTNLYNGLGNGFDSPNAVAVDSSNSVIVTGSSMGSGSGYDFATVQYSSVGFPLWTNRYIGLGTNTDAAYAVAVDTNSNVIVTGVSTSGDWDYVTIKYSNGGMPLWNKSDLGASVVEVGVGGSHRILAVDGNNDVIVTGEGDDFHYTTIKYSSAGVSLWTNYYSEISSPNAIAVDGSNNVIVTGVSGFGYDYATIKYSAAGVPLWTNLYNGPENGFDASKALAVDGSNNVIVTGQSWNGTNYDYATIKYSAVGVPLCTNLYNGPGNGFDAPNAVAVDGSNNVIVTGQSWNGTNSDYATIKYSSDGLLLWTDLYNGPGNGDDSPSAVAVDRSGNVFVTGYSWNGTNYDYATIKYSMSLPPISLSIQILNNQVVLSWTNAAFGLQSAPVITGTFTNLPGASSPCTNALNGDQQYFRLISN